MNNRIKFAWSLIILLVVAGCAANTDKNIPNYISGLENLTVYEPVKNLPTFVTIVEKTVFGLSNENPIGSIAGIAVDNDGRVFIGDDQQLCIHKFNADGSNYKKFGTEGEGPGELQSMDFNMKIKSESLYLFDPALRRVNVFSLKSLNFNYSINLSPAQWGHIAPLSGAFPSEIFPLNDHALLLGFSSIRKDYDLDEQTAVFQNTMQYYIINTDGKIISDLLLEQDNGKLFSFRATGFSSSFTYPFLRKALFVSSGQKYYLAQSDEFLIKVYDANGSYLQSFYYPFKKKKLTREQAVSISDDVVLQSIAQKIQLPETWPILNNMLIDNQKRIWISTVVENSDIYEWWILKKSGELVAKFNWPKNKSIEIIKNDFFYTRETIKETGMQKIVKYQFELTAFE